MHQSNRNLCAKFNVDPLSCFHTGACQVFTTQKFPQRNSSNHGKCNIKFSLNTFSDQITICQISFEIFEVKQIATQAKKYLNSIRVFPLLHLIFLLKWNKQIFSRIHKKDQKQLPEPAILLKKRHSCFLVNFAKFPRTSFLTEHL